MLFDKPDLPGTIPFLELLFPRDRVVDIVEHFIVYEQMHPVSLCKSGIQITLVLVDSPLKIVCDADVKCAVSPTRQYVYEVVSHNRT